MASYVLVFKGGGGMAPTEEQRQTIMAAWGAWFGKHGAAITDGGNPFGPSTEVAADGTTHAGAASGLTGYSILKADSMDQAVTMAKDCPVLAAGGSIEVYETFPVM